MNEPNTNIQIGEWPAYEAANVNTNKHLTERIRVLILQGKFFAETPAECNMVKEYKASGKSVSSFLETYRQ